LIKDFTLIAATWIIDSSAGAAVNSLIRADQS